MDRTTTTGEGTALTDGRTVGRTQELGEELESRLEDGHDDGEREGGERLAETLREGTATEGLDVVVLGVNGPGEGTTTGEVESDMPCIERDREVESDTPCIEGDGETVSPAERLVDMVSEGAGLGEWEG